MSRDRDLRIPLPLLLKRTETAKLPTVAWLLSAPDEVAFEERAQELVDQVIRPAAIAFAHHRINVRAGFEDRPAVTPDEFTAVELVEDTIVAVLTQLSSLRALQAAGPIEEIRDLRSYVAMTAERKWNDHVRGVKNRRYRVGKAVNQALREDPEIVRWKSRDGLPVAGEPSWRDEGRAPAGGWGYERLLAAPRRYEHEMLQPTTDPSNVRMVVRDVLRWVGAPVAIADLITIVQAIKGDYDPIRVLSVDVEHREPVEGCEVASDSPDWRHIAQQQLDDILTLPLPDRLILVLGGREISLVHILFEMGLRLREIAPAVEMTPDRLAELFNRLPFKDEELGKMVGMSIGVVRNRRCNARRKLRSFAGEG